MLDQAGISSPVTAVERARQYLLRLIDLGLVGDGERLPTVEELSPVLGVSRPIILQALASLKHEGRVVVRRGSGARVAPPSPESLESRRARIWRNRSEILQSVAIREMLLIGVYERVAERGLHPDRLQQARRLIDEMAAAPDRTELRRLDFGFHTTIERGAELPLAEAMLLHTRAVVAATFEFLPWPADRSRSSDLEHRRILDAIEARSSREAGLAVREHMAPATAMIGDLLGGDGKAVLSATFMPRQS
jgi:GntR family transcriptional regulator, transcriptional repressor for pyruvate dehydrogenase complex